MIDNITLSNESKEFMRSLSDDSYLSYIYWKRWYLSKGIDFDNITFGKYPMSRYIGMLEFGDVLNKIERFYSGQKDVSYELLLIFYDAVKISNNFNDMRIFKDIATKETFPHYAFGKVYSEFAQRMLSINGERQENK